MDIIKTSLGLSKTIKNVARLKEIVSVLAKNGFGEFIIKTGLHNKIPNFVLPKSSVLLKKNLQDKEQESWSQTFGYLFRKSFEELGSSFIKLGQLLSTREDIFDPSFINEMKKLQNQVKPFPFEEAKAIIAKSLHHPIEDIFETIAEEPIGMASIGVAFWGRLKNGQEVVIKVRRPHIVKNIQIDFSLLLFVISQFEKVSQEIKYLGISRIIHDFSVSIQTELDFRIEALNCQRFQKLMSQIDEENIFYVPNIFQELCSEEVMVMEFLKGTPFSESQRLLHLKDELKPKLETGIKYFVHNILVDGFFHADLHGGNFFLLDDGRIGLIDFGLMGTLGKKSRSHLVAIMYALVTNDYENLVYEFLEVAEYNTIPDVEALIRDVKESLSPFIGLTVQQVNISVLFRKIMLTLTKHQMYLPREWFIIFRSLTMLDGVGKSLQIDFDIFAILEKDIRHIIKELTSKEQIIEEALWIGRDVVSSLRGLPRHLRWFLKEAAKRNYALEVVQKGYQTELKKLSHGLSFLTFGFLAAVFSFCGVYLLPSNVVTWHDIPSLTWVFWSFAAVFILFGFFKNRS